MVGANNLQRQRRMNGLRIQVEEGQERATAVVKHIEQSSKAMKPLLDLLLKNRGYSSVDEMYKSCSLTQEQLDTLDQAEELALRSQNFRVIDSFCRVVTGAAASVAASAAFIVTGGRFGDTMHSTFTTTAGGIGAGGIGVAQGAWTFPQARRFITSAAPVLSPVALVAGVAGAVGVAGAAGAACGVVSDYNQARETAKREMHRSIHILCITRLANAARIQRLEDMNTWLLLMNQILEDYKILYNSTSHPEASDDETTRATNRVYENSKQTLSKIEDLPDIDLDTLWTSLHAKDVKRKSWINEDPTLAEMRDGIEAEFVKAESTETNIGDVLNLLELCHSRWAD